MEKKLNEPIELLMIRAEKVAFVHKDNSLEHALLVLTQSGYSAIPVLNYVGKIFGLIGTPIIMNAISDVESINFKKLESIRVEEVMNTKFKYCNVTDPLIKVFPLLIDTPFLCVIDSEKKFQGILTRREVLKEIKKIYL